MPIVLNPDQQAALQAVIDAQKSLDAAKEAGVRAADDATKILTRGNYSFNGHMIRLLGYGYFTVERLENVPGEVPYEPLAERVSWEGVQNTRPEAIHHPVATAEGES